MTAPRVGDRPPDLTRHLDSAALVAYAGATWDWYRTHHDQAAAEAVGLPRPIVDGQMLGALLAEHAQDWAGPQARLLELDFRFASMVFAGDEVRVVGQVTEVEHDDGHLRVTLEQQVLVGDTPAVAPAVAVLSLPAEAGP